MKIRTPEDYEYERPDYDPLGQRHKKKQWNDKKRWSNDRKATRPDDKRLRKNFKKTTLKKHSGANSKCHTVWIRNDLYACLEQYAADGDRTKRSVWEEALYEFLIKEGRIVPAIDSPGENPEQSSWKL